ncbi:MAG: hypothetical protein ACYTG5_10060 [Planctomycetota bacterium]|jgi:hypothetical protein
MKPSLTCLILATLPLLSCSGGSSSTAVNPADSPQAEFLRIDVEDWPNHRFFPLTPGTVWLYAGEKDGEHTVEEVRVLDRMREVWGTRCAVIQEHIFVEGVLEEMTWELFGLDSEGNIWKFGEESLEREEGEGLLRSDDSWFAGDGEGLPWIAFPAEMRVGDEYAGYTPEGLDKFRVASVTAGESVPYQNFSDCLELVENEEDEDDMDIILYAPKVGRVSETNSSGRLELVDMWREVVVRPGRGARVVRNFDPDPVGGGGR